MCRSGLTAWTALLTGSRCGLGGLSRGGGRGPICGVCWPRWERKNGWQLAEAVGDATPDGMQDFLSRVQWDADAVRDDLHAYVVQHLGDPDGVLILDETGFLKKGTKSAGVQRQYSGTAGRVENCQIGVFLGYASRHGQVLVDRALYLPTAWANDEDRRREARIPTDIAFATKPKLGLAMLERARQAGIPFAWITGDSVYGADHKIRRWAERHRRGYVLAVTSKQYLGQRPVTSWIKGLPRKAWQRLSAGDGAKGPRLYDWVYIPYSGAAPGFQCGLLVRRSIAKPTDLTFYLTHAPKGTSLARLVQIAGLRWPIESLFEQGKGEVGLDQYEVRSWVGWHRHITLAMFALAYLTVVRKDAIGGVDPMNLAAELLPLTVPEVRRLLWALVSQRSPPPRFVLRWSAWRRKHQQRARRAHWRKRTQRTQRKTRL
jgi:SRSO17 transposase